MISKNVMKRAFELMSGSLKDEIKNNLENPKFTDLKNSIVTINKEKHSKIIEEIKYTIPKTQSTLSVKDVERWLERAKKNDQLIYYTGSTFDRRSVKEESVFRKARNLAMEYDNIPFKNKKYQYRGSIKGEWGCTYKNIITLVQQRVAKEQRDIIWDEDKKKYIPGDIISYPIYNYIMIKQ